MGSVMTSSLMPAGSADGARDREDARVLGVAAAAQVSCRAVVAAVARRHSFMMGWERGRDLGHRRCKRDGIIIMSEPC